MIDSDGNLDLTEYYCPRCKPGNRYQTFSQRKDLEKQYCWPCTKIICSELPPNTPVNPKASGFSKESNTSTKILEFFKELEEVEKKEDIVWGQLKVTTSDFL